MMIIILLHFLIINIIKFHNQNKSLKILEALFENKIEGKKLFTVDVLMSIFYQFEYFCWKYNTEHLDHKYLDDIDDKAINEIRNNLDKNKFKIITTNKLLKVIRRFISRYLLSKRSSNDIYKQNKLIDFLNKRELWDYEGGIDKNELKEDLRNIFKENIIYVKQALKLYESLGKEEDEDYQEKNNNKILQIYNYIKTLIPNLWNKNKHNNNLINDLDLLIKKERKSIGSNSDEEESLSRDSFKNSEEEKKSRESIESKSGDEDKSDSNRESNCNNKSEDS